MAPKQRTLSASGGAVVAGPTLTASSSTKPPKPLKKYAKGGGTGSTINPVYGERRPMTYNLFETEVQSISALNGEALRYFSVGGFVLSCVLNIIVGYGFAGSNPLSEIGKIMLYDGAPLLGLLSALCFGLGSYAIHAKTTIVNQIKSETVARR